MKCEEASTSEVRFYVNRVKAFAKKFTENAHANGQHLNTSGGIMKFILWLKAARKVVLHPARVESGWTFFICSSPRRNSFGSTLSINFHGAFLCNATKRLLLIWKVSMSCPVKNKPRRRSVDPRLIAIAIKVYMHKKLPCEKATSRAIKAPDVLLTNHFDPQIYGRFLSIS